MLAIMAKCFFSGETFLVSLIPLFALNAVKLFDYLTQSIATITRCGGTVHALICDNNRVNQSCYVKQFTPLQLDSPWIVKNPSDPDQVLYLLYDPVHIMKNIRNNWINEKTQTLFFYDQDKVLIEATWQPLKTLYKHERDLFCSNSRVTAASVQPSKLERQKVSLVLNVFCDPTVAALKTSSCATRESRITAMMVDHVTSFWKLLNCKSKSEAVRRNDPARAVLDNTDAGREAFRVLEDWAENRIFPQPDTTRDRVKTLTKDTANAISWTCKAFIALSNHLLQTDTVFRHDYVRLGFFQQDDLEKHFGYFRRSAGCNYFITTKEVFATHSLDKAKQMLKVCEEEDIADVSSSHSCELCSTTGLSESEMDFLSDLPGQVEDIAHDNSLNLFYMAGYVAYRHHDLRGRKEDFDFEDSSSFLAEMDRGKLSYPSEELFSFMRIAFLFFTLSTEKLCRKRFVTIMAEFPSFFCMDLLFINNKPLFRIANLLFKRFSMNSVQSVYEKSKRTQSQSVSKLTSSASK